MAESDSSLQGLLVISCAANTKTVSLIQKILKTFNGLSNECKEYEPKVLDFGSDRNVNCYELNVNNKYYLANISLFDTVNKQLISKRFADCVHGVIVYFDYNEDSSFVGVQSWMPYINDYNNELKILICESLDDNNPQKRNTIEKWCLDNRFELVELCPQIEDQDSDNDQTIDDFKDVDGMVRITQVIQSYNWPYITLKESPQYTPSPKFRDLIDREIFNNINDNSVKECDQTLNPMINTENTDSSVEEENEFENFDNLFTKFNQMKASQMNNSDRKVYAEKVTLAFWRAIGGDQHDIEGIDDQ